jgi:hypothetical protein
MLTGKPPPVPAEGAPPSLLAFCLEPVPRALDELVARCLEPRSEARLVDVVALTRELREIVNRMEPFVPLEDAALLAHDESAPPRELASSDSDSSGSLFNADSALRRSGITWIVFGLLLALAAVWLVWHANGPVLAPTP